MVKEAGLLFSSQDLLDCRHDVDCRRSPSCLYDQEREPHDSPSVWPAHAASHSGMLPGHGTKLLPPSTPAHHCCVSQSYCRILVTFPDFFYCSSGENLASFPCHSQILSCNCGPRKFESGLGTRPEKTHLSEM